MGCRQSCRHVALKLLDPGLHANPDFAVRFAREARFLGKLAHPNIVAIHDFGETAGFFWLS
jgi:serine/threonine protein kinase